MPTEPVSLDRTPGQGAAHPPQSLSLRDYSARVAIAMAAVGLLWLAWYLRHVVALSFAALVVAVLIDAAARPLRALPGLGRKTAAATAIVLFLAAIALAGWLAYPQVSAQAQTLMQQLPMSVQQVEARFGGLLSGATGPLADAAGRVLSWSLSAVYAVTGLILVVMLGAFLCMNPARYRDGIVSLFPAAAQPDLRRALTRTGEVLHRWLLGKLVSMTVIGVGVGLGTWALGLPAPFMLGLIAGLFAFVPIVGPIAAAVPGLLLALSMGTGTALWTLALYFAIEQIESNLILPLVEGEAAGLPPALLIVAFAAAGALFGILGAVIAAPLAVALYSLVKLLYLGDDPVDG